MDDEIKEIQELRRQAMDPLIKKAQRAYWSCKARCNNPAVKGYGFYGGRGIKCLLKGSQDLIDAIGLPPNMDVWLDRIDSNGHYEPGNLRWADAQAQQNNRRDNRILEIDGEKKTMAQWADQVGLPHPVLFYRLQRGWPVKEAVFLPRYTKYLHNPGNTKKPAPQT